MNREAGLEYGFSWWRRAAAVAAAGTLSLSLVGCENQQMKNPQGKLNNQKLRLQKRRRQLRMILGDPHQNTQT